MLIMSCRSTMTVECSLVSRFSHILLTSSSFWSYPSGKEIVYTCASKHVQKPDYRSVDGETTLCSWQTLSLCSCVHWTCVAFNFSQLLFSFHLMCFISCVKINIPWSETLLTDPKQKAQVILCTLNWCRLFFGNEVLL